MWEYLAAADRVRIDSEYRKCQLNVTGAFDSPKHNSCVEQIREDYIKVYSSSVY